MTASGTARLLILVSPGCDGCGPAGEIAAKLGRRIPEVAVSIIDVTRDPVPAGVILVGTPMYLDATGSPEVLSLGTPSVGALVHHFKGAS